MPFSVEITLFLAGAVGGLLNSVVGGATFVVFPALLFAGIPAVSANATSSVVVWPGALSGLYAYREDMTLPRRLMLVLGIVSFAGGAIGAWLLMHTPGAAFVHLIPWLLLFASTLFTFGGKLAARLGTGTAGAHSTSRGLAAVAAAQFFISIYGGYFGAGMGILMLAAYAVASIGNIHTMNGLRSALGLLINGVAIVWFMISRAVVWRPAILMAVASTITGYAGARVARRVKPARVRLLVGAVAWGMTVYFFVKNYHLLS